MLLQVKEKNKECVKVLLKLLKIPILMMKALLQAFMHAWT